MEAVVMRREAMERQQAHEAMERQQAMEREWQQRSNAELRRRQVHQESVEQHGYHRPQYGRGRSAVH